MRATPFLHLNKYTSQLMPGSFWPDSLTGHSSFTVDALVSKLRHAPHPLGLLCCLSHALFNITTHSLNISTFLLWAVTVLQSQGAAERVDPHTWPETEKRQTDGASVVPLLGETLSLLLLLNTLEGFHQHGAEESGDLLHLRLILHQHLSKPENGKKILLYVIKNVTLCFDIKQFKWWFPRKYCEKEDFFQIYHVSQWDQTQAHDSSATTQIPGALNMKTKKLL